MVMVSKLSNFPDKLSENDELREFKLSGSDCLLKDKIKRNTITFLLPAKIIYS